MGCSQESNSFKDENMSDVDYETKTYCMGRFLIDVPASLTPVSNISTGINGVSIRYLGKGSDQDFQDVLNKRAAIYRAMRKPKWGESALLWTKRINDLFIIASSVQYYKFSGGVYDAYFQRGDDMFKLKYYFIKGKEQHYVDKLIYIAKQIEARSTDTIPGVEGACLAGAFYKGPIVGTEYQSMTFRDSSDEDHTPLLIFETSIGVNVHKGLQRPRMEVTGEREVSGYLGKEKVSNANGKDLSNRYWAFQYWGGSLSKTDETGIWINLDFTRLMQEIDVGPYDFDSSKSIWAQMTNSIRPMYSGLK